MLNRNFCWAERSAAFHSISDPHRELKQLERKGPRGSLARVNPSHRNNNNNNNKNLNVTRPPPTCSLGLKYCDRLSSSRVGLRAINSMIIFNLKSVLECVLGLPHRKFWPVCANESLRGCPCSGEIVLALLALRAQSTSAASLGWCSASRMHDGRATSY